MKRIKSSRSLSCLSVTPSAPKHTTHTTHTLCKIPVFSIPSPPLLVCVCLFAGRRSATSAGCTLRKWSRSEGRNIKTNQHPAPPPPPPPPSRCRHLLRPLVLDHRHVEDKMAGACLTTHPGVLSLLYFLSDGLGEAAGLENQKKPSTTAGGDASEMKTS